MSPVSTVWPSHCFTFKWEAVEHSSGAGDLITLVVPRPKQTHSASPATLETRLAIRPIWSPLQFSPPSKCTVSINFAAHPDVTHKHHGKPVGNPHLIAVYIWEFSRSDIIVLTSNWAACSPAHESSSLKLCWRVFNLTWGWAREGLGISERG